MVMSCVCVSVERQPQTSLTVCTEGMGRQSRGWIQPFFKCTYSSLNWDWSEKAWNNCAWFPNNFCCVYKVNSIRRDKGCLWLSWNLHIYTSAQMRCDIHRRNSNGFFCGFQSSSVKSEIEQEQISHRILETCRTTQSIWHICFSDSHQGSKFILGAVILITSKSVMRYLEFVPKFAV